MSLTQKEKVIEKSLLVGKRIFRVKNRQYLRGSISLILPPQYIGKRIRVKIFLPEDQ